MVESNLNDGLLENGIITFSDVRIRGARPCNGEEFCLTSVNLKQVESRKYCLGVYDVII